MKYTSIDRIFSKLQRDLGVEEINEGDVIEWSGEALEAIDAHTLYEESVCFIEVINHQCILPAGLHAIIQVARNNMWDGQITGTSSVLCPQAIIDANTTDTSEEKGPTIPVQIDCKGMPINDYDLAYYRPFFDLQYEYFEWCNSNYYHNNYTPVRLADHSFFDSVVCQENDDNVNGLYSNTEDEYTVINEGKALRFSFKEGSVAISYTRQQIDSTTGYPLIPDQFSYVTAVTKYSTLRIMERFWYMGREGYGDKVRKAEADWQWYCKQAGNRAMMPNGVDQLQNILDQRNYLLPRLHRYYGFFGNLGRMEKRKYNDPDSRNLINHFRGNYG